MHLSNAHAELPNVITNNSLPRPISSAARQCSPDGNKIVYSNLDLSVEGYVACPQPAARRRILESNANELIAPEKSPVQSQEDLARSLDAFSAVAQALGK